MEIFQTKHFQLEDQGWIDYLMDTGVVVIKNVLNKEEVSKAICLFWDWMQNLKSGLDRTNSLTWLNASWPGMADLGFFTGYGGCHSKAAWYIRNNSKVKTAFQKIWKLKSQAELITSFDTFIVWRPWWQNHSWNPYVENLHSDQNPSAKKGFHCVQGMVPLYDVNQAGGLMIVPYTNNDKTQTQLQERYPNTRYSSSDWLQLRGNDPLIGKGILVECQAGDLILWDSRTIHGGLIKQPSLQYINNKNKNELVRLSLTVCMTPKYLASEKVLERRRQAFKKKIGLTHWPYEYRPAGMNIVCPNIKSQQIIHDQVELTEQIQNLIG